MAQEWAKSFYNSKAWQQTSGAYMSSKAYICERCGGIATICHHRKWLNANNISNPYITLSFDNLESLCQECHNKEHMQRASRVYFDEAGNVERVRESAAVKEYKQAAAAIEELLKKIDREK